MAFCTMDEGAAAFDVTAVDNLFITEYMLRARGDYVKVYLYALMLCAHPAERMSLVSMARDLDMEEEEVIRAFKYWSRLGLVRQSADNPPAYTILTAKQLALGRAMHPEEKLYRRDFMDEVHRILRGKSLSRSEDETIMSWIETYDLPEQVVLMLLQMEMERSGGRVSIGIADKKAREWAQSGVRSVEDVEKIVILSKEREKGLRGLLRRLGQRHAPSDDEKELYRKWLDEWGFTPEAVLDACRETTKGAPTMAYLDAILLSRYQKGYNQADGAERERSDEALRSFAKELLAGELGSVGHVPTEEDIALVRGWQREGAEDELIRLAARTAHKKRKNGGQLTDVGDMLSRWRAGGLTTAEAVREESERVKRQNAALHAVYEAAGIDKRPGAADRQRLADWRSAGQSMELILLAAEYAKNRPAPLDAMNRILSDWKSAQITTVEAAKQEHERHAQQPKAAVQPQANDYLRRSYTDEEYRGMMVNLDEED